MGLLHIWISLQHQADTEQLWLCPQTAAYKADAQPCLFLGIWAKVCLKGTAKISLLFPKHATASGF